MHRFARTNPTITLMVRAQILGAQLREGALQGAQRRLACLAHDGETGAQAAEYAMLGGVSAAACGALVALLKNDDFLKRVLDAVVAGLLKAVKGWF